MIETIELTCIGCPLGCRVTVKKDGNSISEVTGFTCKRGHDYAISEVTAPERTITSTVRVTGGRNSVVSVKTQKPIPKDKIFDCMNEIYKLTVPAPVAIGDILCDNICGTGVALVASSDCQ